MQSLRDTARKAVNTAKRKWNEYFDWLISYVPPPIRFPPKMYTYQLGIDIMDTRGHNSLPGIKTSLKGSALMNNKTMNNNERTYILDEPVTHMGVLEFLILSVFWHCDLFDVYIQVFKKRNFEYDQER